MNIMNITWNWLTNIEPFCQLCRLHPDTFLQIFSSCYALTVGVFCNEKNQCFFLASSIIFTFFYNVTVKCLLTLNHSKMQWLIWTSTSPYKYHFSTKNIYEHFILMLYSVSVNHLLNKLSNIFNQFSENSMAIVRRYYLIIINTYSFNDRIKFIICLRAKA